MKKSLLRGANLPTLISIQQSQESLTASSPPTSPPKTLPRPELTSRIQIVKTRDDTIAGGVPDKDLHVAILNTARRPSSPQGRSRNIVDHLETMSPLEHLLRGLPAESAESALTGQLLQPHYF